MSTRPPDPLFEFPEFVPLARPGWALSALALGKLLPDEGDRGVIIGDERDAAVLLESLRHIRPDPRVPFVARDGELVRLGQLAELGLADRLERVYALVPRADDLIARWRRQLNAR